MSTIPWCSGPGASTVRTATIPLYNVPPGEESYIRFLGPAVVCPVHWVGPRTFPHVSEGCPLCKPHGLPRDNGYAPAQKWWIDVNGYKNWLSIVVSLTDSALLDMRDRDPRGEVWTLFRADKRPRSQLLARFNELSKTPLVETFDVRPTMEQVWKAYLAELRRNAQAETQKPRTRTVDAGTGTIADALNPLRGRLAEEFRARNAEGGVQ